MTNTTNNETYLEFDKAGNGLAELSVNVTWIQNKSVPVGTSSVWNTIDRVWPVLVVRDMPDINALDGGSR